jgi:UDP-glucose 4-epimerase
MSTTSQTVLVTGCAGFIGSNLVDRLIQERYSVVGVDDLSTGLLRNISHNLKAHPSGVEQECHFRFEHMSVLDPRFLSIKGADLIVHLASKKIPKYGGRLQTLVENTHGCENVLELARKCDSKVVLASTSDVYGKSDTFNEDSDLPIGPTFYARWSYATSKIFEEHLCYAYNEAYGIPFVILRYFNCYGPRQNLTWQGGPQSLFISAAIRGEPCIVHGDGCQTRSFTYISDVIDGTILAMRNPQAENEVFNIGNDSTEISIVDLANYIYSLVRPDTPPKIKKVPHEELFGKYDEVSRRVPNISKARRILGFTPKVGLREGLIMTIEWQRSIELPEE